MKSATVTVSLPLVVVDIATRDAFGTQVKTFTYDQDKESDPFTARSAANFVADTLAADVLNTDHDIHIKVNDTVQAMAINYNLVQLLVQDTKTKTNTWIGCNSVTTLIGGVRTTLIVGTTDSAYPNEITVGRY